MDTRPGPKVPEEKLVFSSPVCTCVVAVMLCIQQHYTTIVICPVEKNLY